MLQLIQPPSWFYEVNACIDLFSALVLLVIAGVSYRYYRLFKIERHYADLAIAYGSLAVAFVLKVYAHAVTRIPVSSAGSMFVYIEELQERAVLLHSLFILYMFFFLVGLYLLYSILHKQSRMNYFVVPLLLAAVSYMAIMHYFIYQGVVLLFFIILAASYWGRYKTNENKTTAYLALSFVLLAGSAVLFFIAGMWGMFYVIAEGVQLLGFIGLLVTFVSVFHGKK